MRETVTVELNNANSHNVVDRVHLESIKELSEPKSTQTSTYSESGLLMKTKDTVQVNGMAEDNDLYENPTGTLSIHQAHTHNEPGDSDIIITGSQVNPILSPFEDEPTVLDPEWTGDGSKNKFKIGTLELPFLPSDIYNSQILNTKDVPASHAGNAQDNSLIISRCTSAGHTGSDSDSDTITEVSPSPKSLDRIILAQPHTYCKCIHNTLHLLPLDLHQLE